MPRRWCVDGLICHVFNRAAAKLPLFANAPDYRRFLAILGDTKADFGSTVQVFGYCVMPNHWHLIIRPQRTVTLSQFMQRLTRAHALAFLEDHPERSGAIYQGRFRSVPIQDGYHLSTVLLYVDRNPLKARLVDRAEDWLWSSALGHARLENDALLDEAPGVDLSDWLIRLNEDGSPDTLAELALKKNVAVGDPEWVKRLAPEWGVRRQPVGRPSKATGNIQPGRISL